MGTACVIDSSCLHDKPLFFIYSFPNFPEEPIFVGKVIKKKHEKSPFSVGMGILRCYLNFLLQNLNLFNII